MAGKELSAGKNEFELNAEIVAGSLTSNAKELRMRVEEELKSYSVERYLDNPSLAKTDRALLNKVLDSVAAKRKEVSAKWNEPLESFLDEMKGLELSIKNASGDLDRIVKEADAKEKEIKRAEIEAYWKTLGYKLVSLDKIFNQKWLNKTFKMKNVMLEVEDRIDRIHEELETLKNLDSEDSEILRAFYLETLDLNATLSKSSELKANRERIKAMEAQKASEAESDAFKDESAEKPVNSAEISQKTAENQQNSQESSENSTNQADPDEIMEYTLHLRGTRKALLALRQFIIASHIEFKRL